MELLKSFTSGDDRGGNSHQHFSQEENRKPRQKKSLREDRKWLRWQKVCYRLRYRKEGSAVWAVSRVLCPLQKKQVRAEQSLDSRTRRAHRVHHRGSPWRI